MLNSLHIAIGGAGTAGIACAIALAQRGHSVVVFEKHPTIASIGAGILLQPAGVRALHELGCGEAFLNVSSPIHRLVADNHRSQRLVDIQFGLDGLAHGVCRGALTDILQHRARSLGVRFELGTQVEHLMDVPGAKKVYVDYVRGKKAMQHEWFDAAVLACGSNTQLATFSGFGDLPDPYPWGALHGIVHVEDWPFESKLRQRVHGARRMAGLLPSGRENGKLKLSFFWSLPTSEYLAWRDRPWDDFVNEVTTLWPEAAPVMARMAREDLAFARYRHAVPTTFAQDRVALVGDAAHAMSPQLGLGSTLALEDALVLARALDENPDVPGALAAYSAARLPVARRKQHISKLLTPLFQSRLPAWARDPLFIVGQHIPGVERLMAASLRT